MIGIPFAFLVLEEHPYGREMLRLLLEHNFVPALIIQEVSEVGDVERDKFLERIAGEPVPPRLNQLMAGSQVPVYSVANHNDPTCLEILRAAAPDLIVLGGTRILRSPLLAIPPRGVINAHPGLLPWLRGSASVGWALYKDLPVGATVHYVDPGIDTGDILCKEQLPVYRGDTYERINARVANLSGRLMVHALQRLAEGTLERTPQDRSLGETLKVIPDELLAIARQRLADGSYAHFSPDPEPTDAQSAI